MPTPSLPGYWWDTRINHGRGGWRSQTTGQVVANSRIINLVNELSERSGDRIAELGRQAALGNVTPQEFQRAMQVELRNQYNANTALAKGGWNKVTPSEHGRNGAVLRNEYQHLTSFAQDLADGKLTPEQAAARARLYSGKAYSRFWQEDELERTKDAAYTMYRWRDVRDERECSDCSALAAQGWVPIGTFGTVPGAGDTVCLGNCRCELEYR